MNLTGGRDTDKVVLELLGDRDLLSLMQTDKKYLELGQDFFEKRMKKMYPSLAERKPKDITWAKYYIEMVYYISKLKEEFSLDYYNTPSYEPKKIYNFLFYYDPELIEEYDERHFFIDNYRMKFLIEMGQWKEATEYLSKILTEPRNFQYKIELIQSFLSDSLRSGDTSLFETISKKYKMKIDYNSIQAAAESGNYKIVEYVLSNIKRISDEEVFYNGTRGAILSGNMEMLNYFLKKYPKEKLDWDVIMTAVDADDIKIFAHFLKTELDKNPKIIKILGRDVIFKIIKSGKKDFLKYAIGMYNAYGGDMKKLLSGIEEMEKEGMLKIHNKSIDQYLKRLRNIYKLL